MEKCFEDFDISEYQEYLEVGSHPLDYYPPFEEDIIYDED